MHLLKTCFLPGGEITNRLTMQSVISWNMQNINQKCLWIVKTKFGDNKYGDYEYCHSLVKNLCTIHCSSFRKLTPVWNPQITNGYFTIRVQCRGSLQLKIFCLFCLMFNCIQIVLLLGHIYVKLQSTVFRIKEIIEEYLQLHWRGYGRDNLLIYLKWISFCRKNISFVHILFLFYLN